MAEQPLPVLYKELVPLSSSQHGDWKAQPLTSLEFLKQTHMVPLAVEEFVDSQRFYPIIFADSGDNTPLAVMALNEGLNIFVADDGSLREPIYVPAYIRRYPYMLARMSPDAEELTLCFDPTAGGLGPDIDGFPLFADGQPSEQIKEILGFCETFEMSGQRTVAFVQDLKQLDLLTDGQFQFPVPGLTEPITYTGFKIVDERKLSELRGDQLRKLNQSGALGLIHAHLFSLRLVSAVFSTQVQLTNIPVAMVESPNPLPEAANA